MFTFRYRFVYLHVRYRPRAVKLVSSVGRQIDQFGFHTGVSAVSLLVEFVRLGVPELIMRLVESSHIQVIC